MRHGGCVKLSVHHLPRRAERGRAPGIFGGEAMSDLYPVKPEFAARARIGRDDYQRL